MKNYLTTSMLLVCMVYLSSCVSTSSQTPSQKRTAVINMQKQVLGDLYKSKPTVRTQVNQAAGYAVFDNANVNLILASFGGGYGVVKDNSSGKFTYMKMAEAGIGFGAGVKDFSLIMIFHDKQALSRFITDGWAFGAQADAAAKAGEKGGAVGGEATVDNITVYQVTKSGIALQATIKGTKFWQDAELN